MEDEGREMMKYKVGDKTLLGEITYIDSNDKDGLPYVIDDGEGYRECFSEKQIDKIIIRPKRNIDHIIELWERGKTGEALEFFRDCSKFFHMYEDLTEVMSPYIEPSKYPQLTPEEIKALKLAKACGFGWIRFNGQLTQLCEPALFRFEDAWINLCDIPAMNALSTPRRTFPLRQDPMSINDLLKDEV